MKTICPICGHADYDTTDSCIICGHPPEDDPLTSHNISSAEWQYILRRREAIHNDKITHDSKK
jgi:ribosomal protein L37E